MPINETLRAELVTTRAVATTNWVLEYGDDRAGNPRKAIERAYARAGLGAVACKIHTLRHTAATWRFTAGVDSDRVARALGTTRAMVERTYGHHAPDYLKDAAAADPHFPVCRRLPVHLCPCRRDLQDLLWLH